MTPPPLVFTGRSCRGRDSDESEHECLLFKYGICRQSLANGGVGAAPALKAENCLQAVLPDSTFLKMICLLHQKIS